MRIHRLILTCLWLVLLIGCSGEIGEHFRDRSDYELVKSRFPTAAVKHFPATAPANSKMYGYFVPLQGGDGLQLCVTYPKSKYDELLAQTEAMGIDSYRGVDPEDPDTFLTGQYHPQILLGEGKPEIPNPQDRIFRIRTGPPIDCGLIFRTDQQKVIYWVFRDR